LDLSKTYTLAPEDTPDWKTFSATVIVMMMVEDFVFHLTHRFLHQKWIYPKIHKEHHDYLVSVSIASEYAHPVDFMLSSIIPSSVGATILAPKIHLSTGLMFSVMRTLESIDGHSGYEFPWSPYRLLPFSASAQYHDFHHSHNVGNYSSFFTFWDTIFGTNIDYYGHLEKK
jgi:methylsterol monooxygenase/4-alpha-methyl-delta7-sterol-4alpha-methyl oxidase